MVMPTLILFGFGFGIFTVGGVSLLMAMNQEEKAGAYLALWSVIQLISRGAGIAAGGIIRDVGLAITGSYSAAYARGLYHRGRGPVRLHLAAAPRGRPGVRDEGAAVGSRSPGRGGLGWARRLSASGSAARAGPALGSLTASEAYENSFIAF